jgi:hypothetical protein
MVIQFRCENCKAAHSVKPVGVRIPQRCQKASSPVRSAPDDGIDPDPLPEIRKPGFVQVSGGWLGAVGGGGNGKPEFVIDFISHFGTLAGKLRGFPLHKIRASWIQR